ncbi:MAG: sel1 repeat family protein [Alphaproteobacteria bacterium]|nr:sel1 repeat family protein [Alphaproteobacteria bacterium]
MKKWLILFVCLAMNGAVQADFASAEEAFKNQRYSEAFQQFLPLANQQGNYREQYYVAYLYLRGLGVTKNDTKGLAYLKESLKENYHPAQALMAFLYSQGESVPMDKKKAIELYKKAADQGNTSAMLNLGVAYYQGDGVVRNIPKAIEYLEKIPIELQPVTGRYLGEIYLASGDADAVSRAQRAYRAAAEANDLASFMALGDMFLSGQGGTQDAQKAVLYYTYAAAYGYIPAQYALGVLYANGKQVPRNMVDAHAWLSLAASQKYEPAENALQRLKEEMTLSDIDRARQKLIDLQKNVLGKLESPFKQERVAVQKEAASARIIKRRRR